MPDEKEPTAHSTSEEPAKVAAADPHAPSNALDEAKAAMDAGSAEDEEEEGEAPDAARPEAIARRMEALGEDDEIEKIARAEEAKLAERRKAQRKGKKKGGLEAAATKRLAKIGANAPVKRSVATAVDTDPMLDRAAQISEWAKKNQGVVGGIVAVAVLGLAGFGIYNYRERKREAQASVELAKAVADERGRVGDPDKEEDPAQPKDPRPIFKTADDRREAALRDYKGVEARFGGTGAAILARLCEGSILLDKHDVQGAVAAFTDVKESLLARADAEVRGRALEGLGFAYELKAQDLAGDAKTAAYDEALKSFRELENSDVEGFKELGMYHQARVHEAKDDKPKAIELLKKLHERVHMPEENKSHPFPYLQQVGDDRLRSLDPSALPAKAAGQLGGPGGNQMSDAQLRKMMEKMEKAEKHSGESPAPAPGNK